MSVRLEEISFCYGEKKILDKISLVVREKEHIGILGGSGSGKYNAVDTFTSCGIHVHCILCIQKVKSCA